MSDRIPQSTETAHTPARDDHASWASVCICGMAEEERTGHYPEHEEWCEVPSPLDGEDECGHSWLLRPESDTRECEFCGCER